MTFSKPVSEIIKQRYSCRTYEAKPIEDSLRSQLADYLAQNTDGPFDSPVRFQLAAASEDDRRSLRGLGTYGFIKGATGFIIGAMGPGERNLEDFAYLMERAILYSTDLGLGTCWLGGSFNQSSFAEKIATRGGEEAPAVTATGYIAPKRGFRDRFIRRNSDGDRRRPWEKQFFEGQFGAAIGREAAGAFATPLEMVRLAPSAANKQPWRIIRENGSWHFFLQRTPGSRDTGLARLMIKADLQRIDMGIAMCHFELAAQELGLDGEWVLREPAIAKPDELTEYTASWASRSVLVKK